MTPLQLEEQLGEYCVSANNAERVAVEKQEMFDVLKDAKEILFEEMVVKQGAKTTAEGERKARTSPEWKGWMVGYQHARAEAAKAKCEKNVQVRLWETCRSLLSSKRIERTTGI